MNKPQKDQFLNISEILFTNGLKHYFSKVDFTFFSNKKPRTEHKIDK